MTYLIYRRLVGDSEWSARIIGNNQGPFNLVAEDLHNLQPHGLILVKIVREGYSDTVILHNQGIDSAIGIHVKPEQYFSGPPIRESVIVGIV